MKRCCLIIALFLSLPQLQGQNKKVIIDADTSNEIDDIPAIVLALKSNSIDVLAVNAAQWDRFEVCGRLTMHESWELNNQILQLLDLKKIPSLRGLEYAIWQGLHHGDTIGYKPTQASDFIIENAMGMPGEEKLIVIVTGSATNVASAILLEPKIVDKLAVYFIGTQYDFKRKAFNKNEFNVRSDLNAVDVLFNTKNLELHVMPANVCEQLKFTQTDIDSRLTTEDGIAGMLKDRWNELNSSGRDWIMWDIAIVQAFINPQWAKKVLRKTPPENTPRKIYVYTRIDTQAMMEDFWKVFLE